MPPRRSTRAPVAAPTSAPTSRRRSTKVKEEPVDEPSPDEEEEEARLPSPPPAKKSRASAASKSKATSAPAARSSRKATVVKVEKPAPAEDDEEDEDEEEEEAPVKAPSRSRRAPVPANSKAKTNGRSRRVVTPEPDDEGEGSDATAQPPTRTDAEDDDDLDSFVALPKAKAKPKPKVSKASSSSKPRSSIASPAKTPAARKHIKSEPEEDDGDDIPAFRSSPAKSRPPPTPSVAAPTPGVNDDVGGESSEEDLLEAIRSVPPTPMQGKRGLSLPPSMRRPGSIGVTSQAGVNLAGITEEVKEDEMPQGPRSRLVIHKLVLLNFKSYAGRQEIGPFHKSFSAIVGPNGSGKSNTIDALLFVFGYRASKMRQGKLSELIHNSAEYPDLDDCRVEVWFREIEDLPGPDAYKVVPGSKLVVARSAYRNNSSTYTINEQKSSFTEVTSLLKERGIDLDHKRFLILQGEVESIAQMKPKAPTEHEDGLLEYLEDIIGTSKYKEPIDEALVEVDKLNEERSEKLNRLRLIEKDKAGLEEKKKEAEAWLRNKNDLVRAQSKLYQYFMLGHTRAEQEHQTAIDELNGQMAQEKEKNKDNLAEFEALQNGYDERVKAFEVVKKETAPLVKQLQNLEKQEVQLQEKRKHIMAKGKKLTKTQREDIHAKGAAETSIKDHTESIEKHRRQVDELEKSLEKEEAELEKITDSLKDKTEVFHAQIEVKQKDLEPWSAKINKKQAELDIATNERNMLAEKANAVKDSVADAAKALESLVVDKDAKEAQLTESRTDLAKLKKDLTAMEKKLQAFEEQEQRLRSKASSSRQKTDEAKASQAANTSQNKVLESLNRLKASGRITGFHGRLGDLGTIADKYDVAISTACPALGHLVVDEVKQGEACLSYLKQQNVGRANIYVLEKLGKTIPTAQTPENAPRLIDLITPKDPKYGPAFYKAVRDTLVADTLEQANRLAFGGQRRWRVVTLAGQLIDTSGTMSGGGTRVLKGQMSSKFAADTVRPEVVKQYEQEAEEAGRALDQFLTEKRSFVAELDELRQKAPSVEMAISKVELDIRTGEKRINDARARVKELQAQSKPDAGDVKRISSLEADIASATKEVDKLQKHAGAIQEEIQALQNKILEIGGTRLRSQKAKVDGMKEMIDLGNDQITKSEVGKAKCERDLEKLEHSIATAEDQGTELRAEVLELDNVLAACTADMDGVREKVEMAQGIAEQHAEELQEMKTELDQKQVSINKFRTKEMAIKQKLDDNSKALAEARRQLKGLQERLLKLALDEVDDEDDEDDDAEKPPAETPAEQGAEAPVKQEDGEAAVPARKHDSYDLQTYSEEELEDMDPSRLKGEVAKLEGLLGEGQPNMKALEEYRRREADFLKRVKDMDEVTAARDNMKKRYDDLRKARLEEFMSGFNTISSKLKEMYQMITLGGNAELELVDSMDPFSEGIIFSVMPPKKSWKNISNLSGGEKTLSSLALVFALHVFKPTPLYFMDEIDAALDFRNVSIVANYIKDRTKNAQFIIISLRNDMFELSHRLIGIYKTSNATRSISIDNKPLNPQQKL